MKIHLFHICFALLLPGISQAIAQDARLSYALEEGHTYGLDIEIEQSTSSESSNSDEINISSTWKIDFRLDSTDAEQNLHMQVSYKKLHFAMLAPGLGLDMNSSDGQSPALRAMMDTLEHNSFRIRMTKAGELLELQGLEEVMAKLDLCQARDSLEHSLLMQSLLEAYGPNAFKGIFMLFISYFPSIESMSNWTQDLVYFFNSKAVKMVNRYHHAKSTDKLIVIQGLGMLNSMKPAVEIIDLGKVESYLSGTQTYDFQIDRKSGWLRNCLSRQRVMVEARIVESRSLPSGLKIPSYTETLFEVKGRIEP